MSETEQPFEEQIAELEAKKPLTEEESKEVERMREELGSNLEELEALVDKASVGLESLLDEKGAEKSRIARIKEEMIKTGGLIAPGGATNYGVWGSVLTSLTFTFIHPGMSHGPASLALGLVAGVGMLELMRRVENKLRLLGELEKRVETTQ